MSRQGKGGVSRWVAVVAVLAATLMVAGGVALGKPPGDTPGAQALSATYFARVGWNGQEWVLVESRGVTSVAPDPVDPTASVFLLTFDNPVDTCAWTASANPFFGGPPDGWGPILVGLIWDNTLPADDQEPPANVLQVMITDANSNVPTLPFLDEPEAVGQTISVVSHC